MRRLSGDLRAAFFEAMNSALNRNICWCGQVLPTPQLYPRFANGRRFTKCDACGTGSLVPIAREAETLESVYQCPEYMDYLADTEAEGLAEFFRYVLRRAGIEDLSTPVLDFGAGRCSFQHFFTEWGWTAFESVEPNAASRRAAEARYGLKTGVHAAVTPEMTGRYEAVIANMVLEHLEDPVKVVRENVLPVLRRNGTAVFTVPNERSLNRLVCGPYWIGYSPKEHNWFFGPDSARAYVRELGLTPVLITGKGLLFSEYDRWSPPGLIKKLYKHSVMRVAEALGRGDQLLIVARKSHSPSG